MIVYLNFIFGENSAKVSWSRFCSIASLLISLIFMPGCMQKVKVTYVPRQIKANITEGADTGGLARVKDLSCEEEPKPNKIEHLQTYFKSWRGVRYRYGGVTTKGVDCSGLTLRAYKELYDVDLPRTVAEQARKGTRIQKKNLRPGDLVFFKTGRYSRHVGIYLGENKFIHASRSKGVVQSSLNNTYWRTKYWQAKRFQTVKS